MAAPDVSEETLQLLLQQRGETEHVDYKSVCDLNDLHDLLEIAKDVAAMQAFGGHIVIGVDNNAAPTDEMTPKMASLFDEATLRPKLAAYLPEPLRLISATHEVEGRTVVLVYVHPHPDGFLIVQKLGQHQTTDDKGKTRVVPIMRPGDVFIRRGTSSERWRHSDLERVLAPRDQRIKEEARSEFAATIAAMEKARQGGQLASAPALAFTWQVDAETFDSTVVELIRNGDEIPLNLFFRRVVGEARTLLTPEIPNDALETLLDRITQVAGLAIAVDRPDLVSRSVAALSNIYRLGLGTYGDPQPDLGVVAIKFWWSIIARVEALGAVTVRYETWGQLRELTLQTPAMKDGYYYISWIRHGLTAAANAGLLHGASKRTPRPAALIHDARAIVHRLAALRMDQPDDSSYGAALEIQHTQRDPLLDSICQYDALACVVSLAAKSNGSQFYPSFAGLFSTRAQPSLLQLLDDSHMQSHLLPDTPPQEVELLVKTVAKAAAQEGWTLRNAPWYFTDERLT
ncbi:helix-turn-helix domain-containing protein [Streptomyces mirabilis]|uniref:AlbA family DNA-binding domain-containing protein n=1 Tax=Streptomyces mirabilis TaxID=68239 RepID=UPI003821BE62